MAGPRCSVLIATHGRARYLTAVLDALRGQTLQDFDVVLVDNNVTPTLDVSHFAFWGDRLRLVHEPTIGLSRARNLAVSLARGMYVAFLDDDAIPRPTWLDTLLRGLHVYGAAAAGGSILLHFDGEPPDWLGAEHRVLLAELLYEGRDIPSLGQTEYICGGNMAAAVSTFDQVGGFSERLGRVGRLLRSSEELDWCLRLRAFGSRVSFVAGAAVEHQIPVQRQTERFLLRRAYWQGRSDASLEHSHGRPLEFGPGGLARSLLSVGYSAASAMTLRDRQTRALARLMLCRQAGYSLQYAGLQISTLTKRR